MDLHLVFSALINTGFIIIAYIQTHKISPSLRVLHKPPKDHQLGQEGEQVYPDGSICRTIPPGVPPLQLQMALPAAPSFSPEPGQAGSWEVGGDPKDKLFRVPTPGCFVTFSSGTGFLETPW